MQIPPPVRPGSEVAIVAPSSALSTTALDIGCERYRSAFDLEPVVYETCRRDDAWLRSHPAERAADVHEAFLTDAVDAVVAATGGDDQLSICSALDPTVLRSNPTRFFGISDNTVLHAFLSSVGLVSYYGGQFVPGIALDASVPAYTERWLRRALFSETIGQISPADSWTDDVSAYGAAREWESSDGWRWHAECGTRVVTGQSWGGCLEVLQWLCAADRCVPADIDGGVLLLETSEELPSAKRVERILRCLGERGLLAQFDAMLVGRPKTRHRDDRTDSERMTYAASQRAAILTARDRYCPTAIVVLDVDFGHTDPHVPMPIGARIRVDAADRRIDCLGVPD